MSARAAAGALFVLAGLLGLGLAGGCRPERYFGPYQVEVPSELQERSAGRTFRLPLSKADQQQQEELDYCLEHQPDRQVPCRCDYPVLTVDEQDARLDYRLSHQGGQTANASVWIGYQVPDGDPAPALLPDLPRVEVLAIHLHRLQPGERIDDSFSEEELRQADLIYATGRYPSCEADQPDLPAPRQWLVGVSLGEDDQARVSLEFTVRVRPGG